MDETPKSLKSKTNLFKTFQNIHFFDQIDDLLCKITAKSKDEIKNKRNQTVYKCIFKRNLYEYVDNSIKNKILKKVLKET